MLHKKIHSYNFWFRNQVKILFRVLFQKLHPLFACFCVQIVLHAIFGTSALAIIASSFAEGESENETVDWILGVLVFSPLKCPK